MSLPVNLPELFSSRLSEMRRPPDGLLHASSDLTGSLRHSQLRAAGAPERPRNVADDVVLMTGTLWHSWANEALLSARLPVMQEVKLDRWLPEGWSGTADWIFFDADRAAFVLGDLKTIKGDGVAFIDRDGVKSEHLWQLSAYWHALFEMGLPLVQGFGILYWPKDRGTKGGIVEPTVQECEPLSRELVYGVMEDRWTQTERYIGSLPKSALIIPGLTDAPLRAEQYLTTALAPEQERVQTLRWNKPMGVFDLKLTPHWSAAFCPFGPPLCECGERPTTKIGHYTTDGEYVPREGYSDVEPAAAPKPYELAKRQKEITT